MIQDRSRRTAGRELAMGIYDREYYRREGTGAFAGLSAPGGVCRTLIIVNIICFIVQLATRTNPRSISGPFTDLFDLQIDKVLHGEVWRLITHAFLHSQDWQHIVFNMLGLWWFGKAVEDIYGGKEFLAFYLVAALIGGLGFMGYELAVRAPGPYPVAIGASGAVTAVMVVFAMHFPTATVLLFFIIPMPIILLVVLYVVMDTIGLAGGRGNIAFAAHLGGALFGFLYYKFQWRVLNWWPTRMSMRPRRSVRPRLRVFHEPDGDELPDLSDGDNGFDEKVDAVLEKVARYGKASLNERENQILMKASELYKHRRK